MSGRVKIKSKDKDKKPKIDIFKVIENRFKNMNELRDLIDMDPRKGLVRIRDGPPPRNRPGRAAVFWTSPPQSTKNGKQERQTICKPKKELLFLT